MRSLKEQASCENSGALVTRRRVEEYVRSHFTDPRGYRLSCDQDAISLWRR
jgi:hypothetical protein